MRHSRNTLIWGLSRSSTAGHRAAIALADQLGATIDTPTSCYPALTQAFQNVGQSTCTLGEVRNRADLVIFWNCDPVATHPRHLERYSADPKGLFVPSGRGDRTIIVINPTENETSKLADDLLRIPAGSELAAIAVLRALLADSAAVTVDAGVDRAQLEQLLQKMKTCQYGAVFFGAGRGDQARQYVESLLQLTRGLNKFTRFTAHYVPTSGGLTGAENVLCWQTGFPFAVNFAHGYPRFDPVNFAANTLLEQGEVDACVLVGSQDVPHLSEAARHALASVPTIAIDRLNEEPAIAAAVQFATAIYGIHAPGMAYRMDGVPIPLRQLVPSQYPTDDEVLTAIAARLKG